MKKMFLIVAICGGISLSAFASTSQQHQDGKGRKNSMEKLNLSKEQKKEVKELREKQKAESKKLAKQHREAVNKVLTPEQQAIAKEQREKNAKKGGRHGSATSGKRGAHHKLDAQSQAKLEELRKDYLQKKEAITMSRIASKEQARRLKELNIQYKEDCQKVKQEATKNN